MLEMKYLAVNSKWETINFIWQPWGRILDFVLFNIWVLSSRLEIRIISDSEWCIYSLHYLNFVIHKGKKKTLWWALKLSYVSNWPSLSPLKFSLLLNCPRECPTSEALKEGQGCLEGRTGNFHCSKPKFIPLKNLPQCIMNIGHLETEIFLFSNYFQIYS